MISLLLKLINYAWNAFVVRDTELRDEEDQEVQSKLVSQLQEECSVDGVVTKVNNLESYGIINQSIYFSFDNVCGSEEVNVGSKVLVRAVRQSVHHGWKAVSVQVCGEWQEDVEKASHWIDEVYSEEKEIEGKVTDWFGLFGVLDHSYHLGLDSCDKQFQPVVGDHVIATVCGKKVARWFPKGMTKVEGTITANEMYFGVVNNDIIFFFSSCNCTAPVAEGQIVVVDVVESDQKQFKLRAFSLSSQSVHETDPQSKLHYPDHSAVVITNNLDFDCVEQNTEKVLPVTVRNAQPEAIGFSGCQFQGEQSMFSVFMEDEVLHIPPNSETHLKIICRPQNLGKHDATLIFEFQKFCITRRVSAFVISPLQSNLDPIKPFKYDKRKSLKCGLLDDLVVIPGRKLHLPKANFKGADPQYHIPRNLWKIIDQRIEISKALPILLENLDPKNYVSKFTCLLHLEEMQMTRNMQEFDMFEAVLKKHGDFLCLEVPGLAEGRPSLIIGDRALVFPPRVRTFTYEGFIHEVHMNDIFLKFNESFHQEYGGEIYDVTFRFSRTTIKRQHQSLRDVFQNNIDLLFPKHLNLQKPLVKVFPKSNNSRAIRWHNTSLNNLQKEAVMHILEGRCRPMPFILFGPPGTGKTVTLVEAILQIHFTFRNARILICTPTNSAADLIAQRLIESEVITPSDMVRLNSYQRNVDTIPEFIKPFCKDKEMIEDAIKIPIVIATSSTAGVLPRMNLAFDHFTHLFLDEAGQLSEPETMVPISLIIRNRNASLVLAGDPQQLGFFSISFVSKKYGLQVSYLERIIHTELYSHRKDHDFNPCLVVMLEESYRSHPAIMCYSSEMFYFSKVKCVQNMDHDILLNCELLPKPNFPVVFHGVRGKESREENSPSWFNSTEVVQCCQYLRSLYELGLTPADVGIIAPYRKQVEKIGVMARAFALELCKVGSVEEFQGQERRAIIITTVRSRETLISDDIRHNLGFLCNPRRFNVGVTRAKAMLIVIGNPYVLSTDPVWNGFIKYCFFNGAYVGCNISLQDLEKGILSVVSRERCT